MSQLPTLVLVHGSWHQPSCYDKITKLLQEQYKLKCVCPSLPSTRDNPAATFKDDLDATQKAIADEVNQGRDVIVVAHSYGGIVGSSAIKGFAPPRDGDSTSGQCQSPSVHGHVIGLILIASGFAFTGLSFMDPFLGNPPPGWRVNKETGYAEIVTPPRELFYHDLPEEEAAFWVSQLKTQSLKSLFEGGEHVYAGWQDVPSWYIGTVEDHGLPVLAQRMAVGMAREMGANVEHRELQTSHSPFLSQPEATVGIMIQAIEAFLGKPVVGESVPPVRAVATLPKAQLWKPLSWFKFGLPLAFGHFVGRSILLFGWGRRTWRSIFSSH
ncbi:alpha/beta-hydrolase [Penicillium malachiteum]|uniref:alpha/beta-hydrolase n=1 Tax=Penicillium malachiteum TaxID=1324776 RepID=UPI00254765FF|nr:alpha/beta-hydrolase [Penicillium malachiteum]KAJ5729618.1 alpha/beta-hydrolase [Penicillium malachiteum]